MGRRAAVFAMVMALACLSSVTTAAAKPGPTTSVIGGGPASITSFPFMARITARDALYRYTCSGTVVSPNMVLTAAHCLLNESRTAFLEPATFEVLTGTSNLAVPGVVSRAERLVIDPGYEPSGTFANWHDAGLIQLTAPTAAPAVKLATAQIWGPGTTGFVVGWGETEPEGPAPAEMQVGETVVQSQAYCQQEIGPLFHPLAALCSLDYPTYESATCNGDSGGPLLMSSGGELVEIGITSFGVEEDCPTNSPRVDTRADVEAAWVQREIAAHPPKVVPLPTTTTPTPAATPRATGPSAPVVAPELPRLSGASANHDLFEVLHTNQVLSSRFRTHRAYQAACHSKSSTSSECIIRWRAGAFRYWGIVQISEEWEGTTAVWSDHYWIHQYNELCRSRSPHPGRCRDQLFHE